jgi:hypothetical protein
MKYLFAILCLICSIPSFASNPWDSLLANNKKVTLNFKNQSAHVINNWLTKSSGIPVLMDPSFNKPITISSPNKINLSECFQIYNQMLKFYNYEITKENKWLVIKPIVKKAEPSKEQIAYEQMISEQKNTEIRVIKLKNNNAAAVAKLINELFASPFTIDNITGTTSQNDNLRPNRQN